MSHGGDLPACLRVPSCPLWLKLFAISCSQVYPSRASFQGHSSMVKRPAVAFVCFFLAATFGAQTADPQLLAEINKIKAIDNHSHPPKLVAAGEKDDDFDALPCDPLEPSDATTITRPDNPQYIAAWKALYNYPYNDRSPEHVKELLQTKQKIMQEQGDNFPNWVLDQLGIETELANRVALGR